MIVSKRKIFIYSIILVLIVSGCGVTKSQEALPASSELIVYTPVLYGPIIEKAISPMMKENFNVTVIWEDMLSSEMMTKVLAQKNNPEVSVVCPGADGYLQGVGVDLWDEIDRSIVTNYDQLQPWATGEPYKSDGIAITASTELLQYNTSVFENNGWDPPSSWFKDLVDPRFKNHLGLPSIVNGTTVVLLIFWSNVLDPDREFGNVDAGFEFVKEIKEAGTIHSFPSRSSEVNQLMERGEIWIALQYGEGALQFTAQGAPVSSVIPIEGTVISPTGCSIVKDGPNPEMANQFLNLMISEDVQREFALDRWAIPARKGVELPPEYAKHLALTDDVTSTLYIPDFMEIAEFRQQWHDRWIREIEGGR
jgi:putative spermidine/putrescine transport system substrate-binding protein